MHRCQMLSQPLHRSCLRLAGSSNVSRPTGHSLPRALKTDQDAGQQAGSPTEAEERSGGDASTSKQGSIFQRLKLEKVERLGPESWAGVAAIDRNDKRKKKRDWRWLATLAAGDTGTLLAFAAIGQYSHHHELDPWAVAGTALPFIIGWTGASALLNGYQQPARVGQSIWQTSKCWAPGIAAGVAIRSYEKGYPPEIPFVLVTFASTWVLLNLWRAAITAAYPKKAGAATERPPSQQGSPLEFMQLLNNMVKRW